MIQRVQSLFLVGVVACLGVGLFFPIWQKMDETDTSGAILEATSTKIYSVDEPIIVEFFPTAILGVLLIVGMLVAVLEIFQYRNRLKQMKLGAVNSLVIAAFLGLAVYFTFSMEKLVTIAGEGNYELGMYLPAGALICNLLANRFIRKDEALVRSVDRIR